MVTDQYILQLELVHAPGRAAGTKKIIRFTLGWRELVPIEFLISLNAPNTSTPTRDPSATKAKTLHFTRLFILYFATQWV